MASRVAVAASPPPTQVARAVTDAELGQVQQQVEATVADPSLPGLESLLLDHVSLSTPEGGQVLDRADAAAWLRDHAGPGISVSQVDQGTQSVMLQIGTQGWPTRTPLDVGQVSFSLRPYDANGRPDEENGDWKIDVIDAE